VAAPAARAAGGVERHDLLADPVLLVLPAGTRPRGAPEAVPLAALAGEAWTPATPRWAGRR
jgi:hypothetical protein